MSVAASSVEGVVELVHDEGLSGGRWPAPAVPSIDHDHDPGLGLDDEPEGLNHRDPLTGALDPRWWSETDKVMADLAAISGRARWAGCNELLTVAGWADLHPGEAVPPARIPGQERAVRIGGDGTPLVAEFAVAEMAALLERSIFAGRRLLADVLDLRHRLPALWARIVDCEVEAWQARKIAQTVRPLTLARARRVDSRIAGHVGRLSWSRMQAMLDAEVIAADPDRAARLAEQARTETKVHVGQTDDEGLATVYARLETPDAVWLQAQISRLSDLLASVRGDARPIDQRRATALGLLARPAEAIKLLLEPSHPADDDTTDPKKLAPPVVLYAHVSWETLTTGSGCCRVEQVGPVVATAVQRWLGDTTIALRPVIDLPAGQLPIDGYELTPTMREHLQLRHPHSVFPYAVTPSRGCDGDHSVPYQWPDPGEPPVPGQTGLHNAGPLARFEHRLVTHAGWQRRQPEPGSHLLRAPHGHTWLINNTGTHHLGDGAFAGAVWQAALP